MAFSGAQATLRALRSAAVEEAGKRAEAVARAAEVDRMDGQATVAEVRIGMLGEWEGAQGGILRRLACVLDQGVPVRGYHSH